MGAPPLLSPIFRLARRTIRLLLLDDLSDDREGSLAAGDGFLGNLNPKMLSAIVWTPKRHFLTSQKTRVLSHRA